MFRMRLGRIGDEQELRRDQHSGQREFEPGVKVTARRSRFVGDLDFEVEFASGQRAPIQQATDVAEEFTRASAVRRTGRFRSAANEVGATFDVHHLRRDGAAEVVVALEGRRCDIGLAGADGQKSVLALRRVEAADDGDAGPEYIADDVAVLGFRQLPDHSRTAADFRLLRPTRAQRHRNGAGKSGAKAISERGANHLIAVPSWCWGERRMPAPSRS